MNNAKMRTVLMWMTAALLGVALTLTFKGINRSAIGDKALAALQNQVRDYQKKNEALNQRNAQLYEYVDYLEKTYKSGNTDLSRIIDERERYAVFAGMRDVHNAGLIITIRETEHGRMRDGVLRQFVNELAAIGAQAVSINDERKVAMTEIRAKGDDIVINGVVFKRSASFTIKAIVDPTRQAYAVSYMESVAKRLTTELPDERYEVKIVPEPDVVIKALSGDRIRSNIDLLKPLE